MIEQRTDDWFKVRLGKVTASRISDVMAKTKNGPSVTRNNYLTQLVCERLGQDHRLAPSDEDTLFGLLVLSLAFTGRTASVREAIAFVRDNHQPPN